MKPGRLGLLLALSMSLIAVPATAQTVMKAGPATINDVNVGPSSRTNDNATNCPVNES